MLFQRFNNLGYNYLHINVSGNIASGKSTLVDSLEDVTFEHDNVTYIFYTINEPIHLFTEKKGTLGNQSMLEHYYDKTENLQFQFQTFVTNCRIIWTRERMAIIEEDFMTRVGEHKTSYCAVIVTERCYLDDLLVFARCCSISNYETECYKTAYQMCTALYFDTPHANIIIKVTMDNIIERLTKRNRDGEQSVDGQYLRQLEEAHNHFQIQLTGKGVPTDVYYNQDHETPTLPFIDFMHNFLIDLIHNE